MLVPNHSIFRNNAIKYYMQNKERGVLPRFISWPVTMFMWVLLGLLVVTAFFAWYEQVPMYAQGSGMVLGSGRLVPTGNEESFAVLLLQPSQAERLRVGLPVMVHIGSDGLQLSGKIVEIEPNINSLYTLRNRYELHESYTLLMAQPSMVALISLGSAIVATFYAGNTFTAEVRIGSQRVLSLIPGLSGLVGE